MHAYLWFLLMIEAKDGSKEEFYQKICIRFRLEVSDMNDFFHRDMLLIR